MAPSATRAITTNALIIRPAHRAPCKVVVSGTRCSFIVSNTCRSPMGESQYSELTVSLRYDNHRGTELTVLSEVNNTEARKNAESRTPPHFHNGGRNGELHPRSR